MIHYDKQNKKHKKLLAESESNQKQNTQLQLELDKIRGVLDSTMHEVRRFSGEISRMCEELSKEAKSTKQTGSIATLSESIFYTSGMIAARLNYSDIELNPDALSRQSTLRTGVYKKFEKSRYVLQRQANDKHIRITFIGSSFSEIDAVQAFELVPFVLLDNAIKYSPPNQVIEVEFIEDNASRYGTVVIRSLGPLLLSGEGEQAFDREFRGTNAKKLPGYGAGLGLYLAKTVCDIHGMEISITASPSAKLTLNSVDYADFSVSLRWRK